MNQESPPHPGRPRNAATDGAILRAVLELVADGGVPKVTVTAVAARAGVARATVYLRWPSRAALVGAAAKAVAGGDPFVLTGELERDIRVGAAFVQEVFAAPYFAGILPELMRAALARPPEVEFDVLAPNRRSLATEYREQATTQGFDPTLDPHLVFDLLFGATLSHMFAEGSPPSREYIGQLAEVVIAGLKARSDGSRQGSKKRLGDPAASA